jgi:hypothetical protein
MMQQPALIADEDVYKVIRGQIEHEDNLIAQRLNWFITSQSFLFSAYAITVSGLAPTVPPRSARNLQQMRDLLAMVPVVAILSSVLIFFTIAAGAIAMRNLRLQFKALTAQAQDTRLPPVQGVRGTRAMGMLAPLVLPIVFMTIWLMLLYRDY